MCNVAPHRVIHFLKNKYMLTLVLERPDCNTIHHVNQPGSRLCAARDHGARLLVRAEAMPSNVP